MPNSTADQNLLFGIIALQMDFITRDQLIEGIHSWALEKSQSLGQIFVAKAHLTPERKTLLDALVQEHVGQHEGDAGKSLAALSLVGTSVQRNLEVISDTDVTASLQHFIKPDTSLDDPNATNAVNLGFSSANGSRFPNSQTACPWRIGSGVGGLRRRAGSGSRT